MNKKIVIIIFSLGFGSIVHAKQKSFNKTDSTGITYVSSFTMNVGKGDFAPYYIASNRHGTLTQQAGLQLRLAVWRPLEHGKRFSWSAGIDFISGFSTYTDYQRYSVSSGRLETNRQRPSSIWLQQLYAKLKWKQIFLTIGMEEQESILFDNLLGNGDYVESGNARPIPGSFGYVHY